MAGSASEAFTQRFVWVDWPGGFVCGLSVASHFDDQLEGNVNCQKVRRIWDTTTTRLRVASLTFMS